MDRVSGDTTELDLYRWDGGKLVYVEDTHASSSSPLAVSVPAGLYYVELEGDYGDYVGGYDFTVSGKRLTAASPYVSKVLGSSASLKRGRPYAFFGYAYPVPAVALKVFRHKTGTKKYVPYKTRPARVGSTGTPRRFAATWKPTKAGKYKLRWQTTGPSGMAPGVSACRYVNVR